MTAAFPETFLISLELVLSYNSMYVNYYFILFLRRLILDDPSSSSSNEFLNAPADSVRKKLFEQNLKSGNSKRHFNQMHVALQHLLSTPRITFYYGKDELISSRWDLPRCLYRVQHQ